MALAGAYERLTRASMEHDIKQLIDCYLNSNFFRFLDVPLTLADMLSVIVLLASGTIFLFISAFPR